MVQWFPVSLVPRFSLRFSAGEEPGYEVAALAGALRTALASRARLPAMGAAGRAVVERKFSWTAATDRLLALYEELLTGGR